MPEIRMDNKISVFPHIMQNCSIVKQFFRRIVGTAEMFLFWIFNFSNDEFEEMIIIKILITFLMISFLLIFLISKCCDCSSKFFIGLTFCVEGMPKI